MAIFHKSVYGSFQNGFQADLDGFVATTSGEVNILNWSSLLSDDQAQFIARDNYELMLEAEHELADFRN
jgi:hypothetical protein